MLNRFIISLIASFIMLLPNTASAQQPGDLEACNKYLDKTLKSKDITYIKNLAEDDLVELHFGLGLNLRNKWLRGGRNPDLVAFFNNKGIFHPDDMSGIIIKNYWHYLNQTPFDLDKEIAGYVAYWKQTEAQQSINEANIVATENRLRQSMVHIQYSQEQVPTLALPKRSHGGVFCNEFIPWGNGFVINSLSTYPDAKNTVGLQYKYHYLHLETGKLNAIKLHGFDDVYSVISMGRQYFAAGRSGKVLRVMLDEGGKSTALPWPNADSTMAEKDHAFVKLGTHENQLYMLLSNGLYVYNGRDWTLKNAVDIAQYVLNKNGRFLIPTENITITDNKVYFLQEVLQMRDCELFELDRRTNTLSEFWKNHAVIDNYSKEINSYTVTSEGVLFVAGQRLGKKIVLRESDTFFNALLFDNRLWSDSSGAHEMQVSRVMPYDSGYLLVAENGLFHLKNNVVKPLVFFENTSQRTTDGKVTMQFHFKPRSCAILGDQLFLLGGQFGGVYLVDLKAGSIKCFDDQHPTEAQILMHE